MQVPSKQPWQRLLGGAFAGAASRTLVAPLERLRTIAMAAPHAMPPSHVVNVALRDGGPLGLFRGNTATLVKIVPASAVQFAVYEALRDALKATGVFGGSTGATRAGPKGAGPEHCIAGFVAGAAQCLVSHPLETIRTLMSVPGCTQGSFPQACCCDNAECITHFWLRVHVCDVPVGLAAQCGESALTAAVSATMQLIAPCAKHVAVPGCRDSFDWVGPQGCLWRAGGEAGSAAVWCAGAVCGPEAVPRR